MGPLSSFSSTAGAATCTDIAATAAAAAASGSLRDRPPLPRHRPLTARGARRDVQSSRPPPRPVRVHAATTTPGRLRAASHRAPPTRRAARRLMGSVVPAGAAQPSRRCRATGAEARNGGGGRRSSVRAGRSRRPGCRVFQRPPRPLGVAGAAFDLFPCGEVCGFFSHFSGIFCVSVSARRATGRRPLSTPPAQGPVSGCSPGPTAPLQA